MEENKINRALSTAMSLHTGQYRKDRTTPFITHPLAVYKILRRVTIDEDLLCAALLHDTIEDTLMTHARLKRLFGIRIANLVREVTHNDNGSFPHLHSRQGWMLKLADILHNMSESQNPKYIKKKTDFLLERMIVKKRISKEDTEEILDYIEDEALYDS